jgi:hypothetical protein
MGKNGKVIEIPLNRSPVPICARHAHVTRRRPLKNMPETFPQAVVDALQAINKIKNDPFETEFF